MPRDHRLNEEEQETADQDGQNEQGRRGEAEAIMQCEQPRRV